MSNNYKASDFLIRTILERDNSQVERLIIDVMSEYECIGPNYSSSDPEVRNMYEAYSGKGAVFYVIEKDNKIYGCGGIANLSGEEGVCELRKMYFYHELRGLGLGSRLLEICLDAARKMNYNQCYLETVIRMQKAAKLYLKYGFMPIDKPLGSTGHSGCDAQYILNL